MLRSWDQWTTAMMTIFICPMMHFALAGIEQAAGAPTDRDIQLAWDFVIEPEYELGEGEDVRLDEDFSLYTGEE